MISDEVALPAEGWPHGARIKLLSEDTESGALTGILRLPPGYRRIAGHLRAGTEYFVLSGSLRVGDSLRGPGYYEWRPTTGTQEEWVSDEGTEIFLMARTGSARFRS